MNASIQPDIPSSDESIHQNVEDLKRVSVISIDDNPLIADALSLLLSNHPRLKHVKHFISADGVADVIMREGYTIVVLDYEIPGTDTVGLLKEIKRICPKCPVMVLSAHGRPEFIEAVRYAGASGYTLKSEPPDTILENILRIASGETVFLDGKM